MWHRLRSALVSVVIAGATLAAGGVIAPTVANATQVDVLVVSGTGSLSPGIDRIYPDEPFYTLGGTATAVGTDSGTYPCGLFGQRFLIDETYFYGAGQLFGVCGPSASLACVYVRVVALMTLACVAVGGPGTSVQTLTGELVLVFDQLPPGALSSFSFTGALVFDGAATALRS